MDKNTITAVVLMALVVFGFSYWSSRNNTAEQAQDATEQVEQKKANAGVASTQHASAAMLDSTALFAQATVANDSVKPVVLSNDKIEVTIAPKGGQVSRVVLKE